MKRLFITVLLLLIYKFSFCQIKDSGFSFYQDDSVKIKMAKNYLTDKLGIDFVNNSLLFQGLYYNHEIQDTCDYTTVIFYIIGFNLGDTNMLPVYFCRNSIDPFLNNTDSTDFKLILSGIKSDCVCYNKAYALAKAKEKCPRYNADNLRIAITGIRNDVAWEISTYTKIKEGQYRGRGADIRINLKTGKHTIRYWEMIQ